jgi:hypothetical protein
MIGSVVRDFLSFIIILAAIAMLYVMVNSETFIVADPTKVLDENARQVAMVALTRYFQGMGLALLLAGGAFVLFDRDEDISTVLSPPPSGGAAK